MLRRRRLASAVAAAALVVVSSCGIATLPAVAALAEEPPSAVESMGDYPVSEFADEAAALPPELVTALDRDLDISAAEYLAEAAAATDAVDVVESLDAAGVDVLGSSIEGTQLQVNVASAADVPLVESAGAVAVIGEPEEDPASDQEFAPFVDVYGGLPYSSNGILCSIGFPGYAISTGQARFATAGHCTTAMSGTVSLRTQSAANVPPGTSTAIGTLVAGSFGGGYDSGLVALNAGVAQYPGIATWGGGTGAPLSSGALAVTSQSAAIVGATLCKSGRTTGWTCGTVTNVDYTANVNGNTVNSIAATTCAQPGDSGGAALIGQAAVGITSYGTSSYSCGEANFRSGYFPLVSSAGKPSIASAYGSSWELAVTVPTAPVITSNGGGQEGNTQPVTGTLANATAASKVALFLDGSNQPFATVSAASGNWSISLNGVSAGTHSLQAASVVGMWSRSSAASGSVTIKSGAAAFVTAAYADVLGRSPSTEDLNWWVQGLANGASRTTVAGGFNNSDEYRMIRITEAYREVLGREPEAEGAAWWLSGMQRGALQPDDAYRTFLQSNEYYLNAGGTPEGYLQALYQEILHRDVDQSGLDFWTGQLATRGRAYVTDSIWFADETYQTRVGDTYAALLGRPATASDKSYWTAFARQNGHTAMRSQIMASGEYWNRSLTRFP